MAVCVLPLFLTVPIVCLQSVFEAFLSYLFTVCASSATIAQRFNCPFVNEGDTISEVFKRLSM